MERRLCPKHQEQTPSFVIYEDGHGHCYGCGYSVPAVETNDPIIATPKEDLYASLERIKELPTRLIRGLTLHYDSDAFYILWPGANYYIKRRFDNPGYGQKYLCPAGHPRPLYLARVAGHSTLILVEGELNAASLVAMWPEIPADVASGGSANDLYKKKNLAFYSSYSRLLVVADNDKAGAAAVIKLLTVLPPRLYTDILLVTEDFNDTLVKGYVQDTKNNIEARLVLPSRL